MQCPREMNCKRTPQPETDFLPCPSCGCLGTWRFSKRSSFHQALIEGEEQREINKQMNVGAYVQTQNDQLPLIPASVVGKKGISVKIVAVREIKSPTFKGLIIEVKTAKAKYAHLERFEPGFGISAAVAQLGSEDTDDWMGRSLKFVTKKAKTGKKLFVNIAFPQRKGKK